MSQSLTQSQDMKRLKVLSTKEHVLDASYNRLASDFMTVASVVWLDKPVFERLAVDQVDLEANIRLATIDWNCMISSAVNRRKMKIGVQHKVEGNKIRAAKWFTNSGGQKFFFTEAGFKRAMRIVDKPMTRPYTDKRVTLSLAKEY